MIEQTLPPPDLSASLMCADLADLGREVERLSAAGIGSLHVDVMDGHFVPNLALSPDTVRSLRPLTRLPIHVHLMVERPEQWVEGVADAGADVVFFHIESTRYPLRLAAQIARAGSTPGAAVSASTPLHELPELLGLDHFLLMAVEPGFAGQDWVPSSLGRIARVRRSLGANGRVAVDGHVAESTIRAMRRAGADTFVCGTSGLFMGGGTDYHARLARLRGLIEEEDASRRASAGADEHRRG